VTAEEGGPDAALLVEAVEEMPVLAAGRRAAQRSGARPARPPWLGGLIGTVGLLAIWELLALTVLAHEHVLPTPQEALVTVFYDPSFEMWPNVVWTLGEAGLGFLWGNGVALVLALAFVQVPLLERALLRVVLATYCMPIIAIGPILEIVLSGRSPQVALSGLSVVFTTLIGALVGLRAADPTSLDLVRAYGGGSWRQLVAVRLRSALPATFAGLAISGPAALLGAIVGEYLGASQGLGVALISANENDNDRRAWAIALVATAIAGGAYFAISTIGRLLTPWAPRRRVGS
jgi:ABC-type nitrate/sulfonate/bicarbonate transport system permease component